MSNSITLLLRHNAASPSDWSNVVPDRFQGLSNSEIGSLPVWVNDQEVPLGDLCVISGERSTDVRIEGDLRNANKLGARMRGGRLRISGDAGDDIGLEMRDGEIFVEGSAGRGAGTRARRGLITVGRDAGDSVAHAMIAGTVLIMGRAAGKTGPWNKRGTIVVLAGADPLPTYRYACTFRPVILRVLFTYLERSHGFTFDPAFVNGRYARHVGDIGELGKGELLTWIQG